MPDVKLFLCLIETRDQNATGVLVCARVKLRKGVYQPVGGIGIAVEGSLLQLNQKVGR